MYRIVGTDGKTYGPVDAVHIKQWIAENRVERQTPVFISGAADWTFLALLPEFAEAFRPPPLPAGTVPPTPPKMAPLTGGALKQNNSLAVAGFICGLLSVTCICCCGGFPFNLVGIVLSSVALSQISRQPDLYEGRALAIAGLILSSLGLLFSILETIFQMFNSNLHYHLQTF